MLRFYYYNVTLLFLLCNNNIAFSNFNNNILFELFDSFLFYLRSAYIYIINAFLFNFDNDNKLVIYEQIFHIFQIKYIFDL